MNKNKLIIFFLFFFYTFNIVHAAGKIAYIDIDFLLNQSLAGKSITKNLKHNIKKIQKNLKLLKKN